MVYDTIGSALSTELQFALRIDRIRTDVTTAVVLTRLNYLLREWESNPRPTVCDHFLEK